MESSLSIELTTCADVGLFDADLYGPNVPQMLGSKAEPEMTTINCEDRIEPPTAHGLELMSIGLMVEEDNPVSGAAQSLKIRSQTCSRMSRGVASITSSLTSRRAPAMFS